MAVIAHTQSAHAGSVQRESSALKLIRLWMRWLLAGPREALRVRSLVRPVGFDLAEQSADPDELLAGLQRWRVRLQRRRAGVLLRRHLIVAAVLSIVLQALVVAGDIPQTILLVPLALLLVGMSVELARRPSLEEVAHLLDEQLGLFDRIGTGLDIQRHVGWNQRPLERRAVANASGLTAASLDGSRAAAAPAVREWSSLAVVLVVLAVGVLAGPPITGGSSTRASIRTGTAGTGESAAASVKHAASAAKTTSTGKKGITPSQAQAHPKTPAEGHRSSNASPSTGDRTVKQATQSRSITTSSGKGAKSALGVSPVKAKGATTPEAARNSTGAPGAKGSIGVGSAAKPGTVSALTAPSQKAGAEAHSTSSSTTRKSGSSTPSSKSTSASSPVTRKGSGAAGAPTGSATAGHQRASTQLGNSRTIAGHASHALPLQAEYAPAGAGKTSGSSHSSKASGGGGPGRSALVSGAGSASSSGNQSTFAYIPPDGGALPGGDAELLINYFNFLGLVNEQSW
jgi:hypothetical protein